MNELSVKGLSKAYGERIVLKDLSFQLTQGHVMAVMGPSGAGKTTLLRILMGFEQADEGEIQLPGEGRISAVFQENRLVESLTVSMNLRAVLGKASAEAQQKLLAGLGLADAAALAVSQLSGGMKRRVALARALLYPADLLLLDEPFKGLDDATRESVMQACLPFFADKCVLLVTHEESEACFFGAGRLIIPNRKIQ